MPHRRGAGSRRGRSAPSEAALDLDFTSYFKQTAAAEAPIPLPVAEALHAAVAVRRKHVIGDGSAARKAALTMTHTQWLAAEGRRYAARAAWASLMDRYWPARWMK